MSSHTFTPVSQLISKPRANTLLTRVAGSIIIIGLLLSVISLFGEESRERFGFAYLWGFTFLWTIILGSLFFVGLQHITRSVWSVVLRRAAEALAAPGILMGLAFIPLTIFVLMPNLFHVYPWADASIVEGDHLLEQKQLYLNVPFFIIRGIVFVLLWIGFSRYFVNTSLRQDHGQGGEQITARMRTLSAPFMLVFGITSTFAAIDWLVSLNPLWFSTMFGVYIFSGMAYTSIAAITIVTVLLIKSGRVGDGVINHQHLYSLGALLFAFCCFWAYIAFSQYMLIWYANMPEETLYIHDRLHGNWKNVSIALGLIRFVIPFLILLSRPAKMNLTILMWVSILIVAGQLLDLYWLIMPEIHPDGPILGWQEVGPVLLFGGLLLFSIARFFTRHAPMAIGDPLIEESRQFHL